MAVKVFLRGGLGNQLFQYAAGLYLAKRQEEDVVFRSDLLPEHPDVIANISRWPIQITKFNFEGRVSSIASQPPNATNFFSKLMQVQRFLGDRLSTLMIRQGLLSGDLEEYIDFQKLPRIRVVNSYCASSEPALAMQESLRRHLREIVNPSEQYLKLLSEFELNQPLNVHLRLGDYRHVAHLYGRPNFDRLEQVIDQVLNSSPSPVWLFTDTPEDLDSGLLRKLKVTRVIGPKDIESPLENIVLLSAGSALICSNSTFSWWAAFLKGPDGQVHYPKLAGIRKEVFSEDMVLWRWESYAVEG
jgi:hypothetical protein